MSDPACAVTSDSFLNNAKWTILLGGQPMQFNAEPTYLVEVTATK